MNREREREHDQDRERGRIERERGLEKEREQPLNFSHQLYKPSSANTSDVWPQKEQDESWITRCEFLQMPGGYTGLC